MELINKDIGNVKYVFNRIAEQSKLNELIQTAYTPSNYSASKSICVQIPIPVGFDKYLNSLDKKVRQNLRRRFNRLETDNCAWEVHTHVNQTMPPDIWRQSFILYKKRLSDKMNSAGLKRFLPWFLRMPFNPTFIALKRLPNVFYTIIRIDKAIAGFCAGFTSRDGKIILPFVSINSAFKGYSPGGILITQTIKFLMENHDYKFFDLSREG